MNVVLNTPPPNPLFLFKSQMEKGRKEQSLTSCLAGHIIREESETAASLLNLSRIKQPLVMFMNSMIPLLKLGTVKMT